MAKAKVDWGVRNDIASLTKQIDNGNELDVPGLLRTRAESYLHIFDYKSALNDFDRLVKYDGSDTKSLAMRSWLHSQVGDKIAADVDYRSFAGESAKKSVTNLYPYASSKDVSSRSRLCSIPVVEMGTISI